MIARNGGHRGAMPLSGKSIALVALIALGVQVAREKYLSGGSVSHVVPMRRAS